MKQFSLYLMAGFYVLAGANHFWHPQFYLAIMPPWLGFHDELNYASGACEILFGLLLIPKQTRRIAAWLIILLLIAIFPANIQMMLNYIHERRPGLWITIVRLPIQLLLIWWAYIFAKKEL